MADLQVKSAILDGEIVCLGRRGRVDRTYLSSLRRRLDDENQPEIPYHIREMLPNFQPMPVGRLPRRGAGPHRSGFWISHKRLMSAHCGLEVLTV